MEWPIIATCNYWYNWQLILSSLRPNVHGVFLQNRFADLNKNQCDVSSSPLSAYKLSKCSCFILDITDIRKELCNYIVGEWYNLFQLNQFDHYLSFNSVTVLAASATTTITICHHQVTAPAGQFLFELRINPGQTDCQSQREKRRVKASLCPYAKNNCEESFKLVHDNNSFISSFLHPSIVCMYVTASSRMCVAD